MDWSWVRDARTAEMKMRHQAEKLAALWKSRYHGWEVELPDRIEDIQDDRNMLHDLKTKMKEMREEVQATKKNELALIEKTMCCLLYTSPSPRD